VKLQKRLQSGGFVGFGSFSFTKSTQLVKLHRNTANTHKNVYVESLTYRFFIICLTLVNCSFK